MKGKQFTVQELQDAINKRLEQFNGKKYEDTEYHGWYAKEIKEELSERGITELRPTTWGIVVDFSENGLFFFQDNMAKIEAEFNRDKRFKYGGRGTIVFLRIAFRSDLLKFTMDEARRFLLEEKRDETIMKLKEQRAAASSRAAPLVNNERGYSTMYTFRGKTKRGGKWVEGDLSRLVQNGGREYVFPANGFDSADNYEVETDTVGMASGWRDKTGRAIYKGDIVTLINEDGEQIFIVCEFGKVRRQIYEYEVEISGFYFRLPDGRKCFPIVKNYAGKHDTELYEIVGNIWDTPELIGKREAAQ
ncbi:MAG: hypothetical protein EOM14_15735 [Clostridia bacterium]|nr:hypothetical protein [Clostridia bacterium]